MKKKNATIVIVPSIAVESMQLGGVAGMTALTMGLGQERAGGHSEGKIKKQIDDTARAKELLKRTESETLALPLCRELPGGRASRRILEKAKSFLTVFWQNEKSNYE